MHQHETMIRDFQVSIKLLQEENHKLKNAKDSEQYEKLVQLRFVSSLFLILQEFNILVI